MFLNILVPCDARDYLYHGKNLTSIEKTRRDARFCRTIMSVSPSLWMASDRFFEEEIKSLFPALSNPEMALIWTIKFFIRPVFINNYRQDIRIMDVAVNEILSHISVKIGDRLPQQKENKRDAHYR